jgi:hypothetical protein
MADMQRSNKVASISASSAPDVRGYAAFTANDPVELTEQVGEWGFEFTQLERGKFRPDGAVIDLDGLHVAQVALNQTLLHRGVRRAAPSPCSCPARVPARSSRTDN